MKKAARRAVGASDQLAGLRATLLELHHPRNAQRPPALFLRDLVRKHNGPGPALAQLVGYDPDDRVAEAATMMLFVAGKDPGVPREAGEAILDSAAFALLRALRDPSVLDDRKYTLGPLLELAGHGRSTEEYHACFKDFEATAKKKARNQIVEMSDSIEAHETALASLGIVNHDGGPPPSVEGFQRALSMLAQVAEHNPAVGASLLPVFAAVVHEHGVAADLALAALDIAASTQHSRAAWFLADLGGWPVSGQLGGKARQLAEELAKAGVIATAPIVPSYSHGYVTGTDGAGSRSVMLFFMRGDGALDALSFLLNDLIGVKDVWPVFVDGAEVEGQLRGLALPFALCDLAFARALVADALSTHAAIGRPVPGCLLLYRPLLGDEPIAPAARKPDLGAYLLETVVRGPALVEGTEELLDHPLYRDLWPCGDDAYAFVGAIPKKKGRRSAKAQAQLVDEFIANVASKEKDVLALRLATNLEVEARAGRAKKPLNKLAASVYLAIAENVVGYETVPYVRGLAEHALDAIKKNIGLGYVSQKDVNAHGLAMDAEAQHSSRVSAPISSLSGVSSWRGDSLRW
jgi:hypothetical protein